LVLEPQPWIPQEGGVDRRIVCNPEDLRNLAKGFQKHFGALATEADLPGILISKTFQI
jgi:hypothetical protein